MGIGKLEPIGMADKKNEEAKEVGMATENEESNPSTTTQLTEPTLPRSYNELLNSNRDMKRSWPELVGVLAEEAEKKVKEEMPGAKTQVVPPDYLVTCDFRPERVRLYIDTQGKVIKPPNIG